MFLSQTCSFSFILTQTAGDPNEENFRETVLIHSVRKFNCRKRPLAKNIEPIGFEEKANWIESLLLKVIKKMAGDAEEQYSQKEGLQEVLKKVSEE
jgi:hypothetical protein